MKTVKVEMEKKTMAKKVRKINRSQKVKKIKKIKKKIKKLKINQNQRVKIN